MVERNVGCWKCKTTGAFRAVATLRHDTAISSLFRRLQTPCKNQLYCGEKRREMGKETELDVVHWLLILCLLILASAVGSCVHRENRQHSLSSIDGQSYEVGCDIPRVASDVSCSPPVQYWKPMCVALKYDAYSLSGHDYTATATSCASDLTTAVDDTATTALPPPPPPLQSTVDRRNCLRSAPSRIAPLPAARVCRPHRMVTSSSTHAHCDEHMYEPPANHDAVAASRDHHQQPFTDFADWHTA